MNDSTVVGTAPRRYWLTLLLPALILLLALFGAPAREHLSYQREAILLHHEYWRLLTAHLVHGSWQHAGLNLAGLGLIVGLFRGAYRPWQWLSIALCSASVIDVGLWLLMPQLRWYLGLSGVLHGLLAAGAVCWWRTESRFMALLLSAILLGKLVWEQWQGALPLSGELPVIVNAHLYGALGGLLAALALTLRRAATQTL